MTARNKTRFSWATVSLVAAFFIAGTFSAATAQLPPSLYRVSDKDTAVDFKPSQNILTSSSAGPEFFEALASSWAAAYVRGDDSLAESEMTVDFWAKTDAEIYNAERHHVLFAYQFQGAPHAWGLWAEAGTGNLIFGTPLNYEASRIASSASISDGKWHFIGVRTKESNLQIYLDGQLVGEGNLDAAPAVPGQESEWGIGRSPIEGYAFGGFIDEFRITAGADAFSPETIPTGPSAADAKTLLLLHFNLSEANRARFAASEKSDALSPDFLIASRSDHAASGDVLAFNELFASERGDRLQAENEAANKEMSEGEAGDLRPLAAADLTIPVEGRFAAANGGTTKLLNRAVEMLFPTGALEIDVQPGEKPPKNVPIQTVDLAAFDARAGELGLVSVRADNFRAGVFSFWGERYFDLADRISGKTPLPRGAADQVYDSETLVADGEREPVQIVLRQTRAALDSLEGLLDSSDAVRAEKVKTLREDLDRLDAATAKDLQETDSQVNTGDSSRLILDYFLASAIKRQVLLMNPALDATDRILFLARGCYAGSRLTNEWNSDRIGGHFATQVYGFNTIHGGGLFALSDWRKKDPKIENILEGKTVTGTGVCSRLAGKALDYGSFYAPEVDFDGKTVYFSHCGAQEHRWVWTPDTTWNIFKLTLDDLGCPDELTQLTDSAYNDFDACCLPSGRLVFASERRGGFIRCFGENDQLRVTTSVLHSMKTDGTDIYPISFFETGEWQPSVDYRGLLVYTRWDYTDRENCLGSSFWTCAPDGRNPRSPHGNYPYPWHTFEDNIHGDHRFGSCPDAPSGLPMTEMQIRAIPDSHRYVFTAAPHHGETFGSICVLDLREENDNHMSQIRRVTPYYPFPESESPGRSQYRYGSPWPLNEDLFLCNCWEDLIILDRFGNEELLCEREILPIGYDPRLRLTDPIPLSPRPKPMLIPQQTAQGEDFADQDPTSTIGVINVRIADQPLPEDRPVKRLRVLQVIPKSNPWMNVPWIGYGTENTPRIPLGTVPVEEDGSVWFEAPAGKQLLFQLLDENYQAIQTMRAVTYLHPGEKLVCVGCHEPVTESVENNASSALPAAFARAPSKLEPECGPIEPINFYRLVKPVFEKSCIPCHTEKGQGPTQMDYEDMRPWVYYFSGGMRGEIMTQGPHGGSRSRPGRVGSSEAKLGKILFDENHKESVSEEDRHKIILWLDANALRLGAFRDEKEQMEGKLVWPILDTEACDLYHPCASGDCPAKKMDSDSSRQE